MKTHNSLTLDKLKQFNMKTLFTLLTVLTFSFISNAQLEVKRDNSKVLYENAGRQSLTMFVIEKDTSYSFMFQDRAFTQIVKLESILFSNKAELIQFLDLCTELLLGGEAVMTKKYSIRPANKKWVDISNGVGSAYLKATTIAELRKVI